MYIKKSHYKIPAQIKNYNTLAISQVIRCNDKNDLLLMFSLYDRFVYQPSLFHLWNLVHIICHRKAPLKISYCLLFKIVKYGIAVEFCINKSFPYFVRRKAQLLYNFSEQTEDLISLLKIANK